MDGFDQVETSMTKGSFAHKPPKSKKKKNVRKEESKSASVMSHNEKYFNLLWNKIESKIQDIESSCYQKTFDAVAKFVSSCIQFPLEKMDEIPAAVLQMGVNMPDHSNILMHFERLLRLQKNHAVILESRKCHTLASIVQLIDAELQDQATQMRGSPSKQARVCKQARIKPLVLIIQNVETFNVKILEELIWNCKIYLNKIPVILIFGMSSAMVTLHNILPQRVLCHLGIETFHSFAAAEYLTRIIEEVVISPQQPFKLGPKVLRLVVDTVLYHDFSVTNLKHLLRFSLMKHFYSNKSAIILCSESEIKERVSNLKDEDLQFFHSLQSFKLYKDNNPEIASCLKHPGSLKALLKNLLETFYSSQKKIILSLRILYTLTKDLPGSPLGKQFREIYLLNLEKQIFDSMAFKEAHKLLKFQSQSELLLKLEACEEICKSSDRNVAENLHSIIQDSVQKLMNLTSEDFDKSLEKTFLENETFTSRYQLQEKMRSSIKLRRSKFEAVRNDIVDSIFEYFTDLPSPCHLPLSDIFFFDDFPACKRHLMPSPRVVLCRALSNPQLYLQCKCCKIMDSSGEIPSSMLDISMLYKLHLECGKLINLCDWLESFKALKDCDMDSKKKSTSKGKSGDTDLNICFLHAATELQLLGFVKSTKRKTDHVARLTFGTF